MAENLKPFPISATEESVSSFPVVGRRKRNWRPVGIVLLGSLMVTTAEILLKIGATNPSGIALPAPLDFLSIIFSFWILLGIVAYVASLQLWLVALRILPLHLAYGLSSTVHLLVPIACWLVLHESIPAGRLIGMLFILWGTLTLGQSHK
jgi:multidrug transporter EmrE-like cation transporter